MIFPRHMPDDLGGQLARWRSTALALARTGDAFVRVDEYGTTSPRVIHWDPDVRKPWPKFRSGSPIEGKPPTQTPHCGFTPLWVLEAGPARNNMMAVIVLTVAQEAKCVPLGILPDHATCLDHRNEEGEREGAGDVTRRWVWLVDGQQQLRQVKHPVDPGKEDTERARLGRRGGWEAG